MNIGMMVFLIGMAIFAAALFWLIHSINRDAEKNKYAVEKVKKK